MDEAFIKKVQPNSPEAEQSVIGAMIMDRDAIADVIDIVNADGVECVLTKSHLPERYLLR